MFETERLRLRKLNQNDVDELWQLRADPAVAKYLGNGDPPAREVVAKRLQFYMSCYESHNFGVCGVSLRNSEQLIGWSGLQPLEDSGEIEVGYGFTVPHWGHGFATEVAAGWLRYGFETAKLERIVAIAISQNVASTRVMEKLGMSYEGEVRYYDCDCVLYAISRAQYLDPALEVRPPFSGELIVE